MDCLVPGDLVQLSAGDMIPADLRLLGAKDLFISQSALTGESIPTEKHAQATEIGLRGRHRPDKPLLHGSQVVSGYGPGVMVKTGATTFSAPWLTRSPDGAFYQLRRGINKFTWLMIRFMIVMVPAVFLINGFTKHDWIEAFLFALAVAVGLTPEMLPMIVTVNLAKGALAMSAQEGHRQAPQLDPELRRDGRAVHGQDRHADAGQGRAGALRRRPAASRPNESCATAYLNSYYQTGLKNLLDMAVLDA